MRNETAYSPVVRQRIRIVGAVVWPAFLTAAVATMIFFANIDPATLRAQTVPNLAISREAGYAIGFFMFWAIGIASSATTLMLIGAALPGPPDARTADKP